MLALRWTTGVVGRRATVHVGNVLTAFLKPAVVDVTYTHSKSKVHLGSLLSFSARQIDRCHGM